MKRKRIKQRAAVGRLGKFLTRRSGGRCELCEDRAGLQGFELVPFSDEPTMERSLLACARCREWLERGGVDPIQARFLESAVWSQEPAVRLAAARLLLVVDDLSDPWLQDALDAAGVDPVTQELR
ncbi:MAG: protein PhnA [Myxococcota bacterium]|jgi:protein PhnA